MSQAAADCPAAPEDSVAGIQPWLPWPLRRWRRWTEPVRAERLAALRIGLALVLLLDILFTYLPHGRDFFGRDSLGSPERFSYYFKWKWAAVDEDVRALSGDLAEGKPFDRTLELRWRWSLLKDVEDPRLIRAALLTWAAAAFLLLIGLGTRLSAVVVWALATSIAHVNPWIGNAGDVVRGITLFYLMLAPCGAAWSVDAWLKRRLVRPAGPVRVHPWVLCLLFLQLVLIYWSNGLHKLAGADWPSGDSLYYVLGDLRLTRWSYAQAPVPYLLTRWLTWTVLVWELAFPLLVCWRPSALIALAFGVVFHVGIGLTLELGGFAPYMLCLYLPLLPWERIGHGSHVISSSAGASTRR